MDKNDNKTVAQNKKAYHDYFVLEEYEAGIELFGTEIKSIRQGKINLKDAWCNIVDGEIFVNGMHISPYDHGNIFNRDPMRRKRLLLHKNEILKLAQWVGTRGGTIIPLKVYLKQGLVKIEIAFCQGKSHGDKRDTLRKRQDDLEMRRAFKR